MFGKSIPVLIIIVIIIIIIIITIVRILLIIGQLRPFAPTSNTASHDTMRKAVDGFQ